MIECQVFIQYLSLLHVRISQSTRGNFELYLTSQRFRVVRAFDGIQHDFTHFVEAVQS